MARFPGLDFSGIAQHVVQRGIARQPRFVARVDHQRYRRELAEATERKGCAMLAYALMTHQVRLLVTPAEVGCLAEDAGHRVRPCGPLQLPYRRSRTLGEGGFKSTLADSDRPRCPAIAKSS